MPVQAGSNRPRLLVLTSTFPRWDADTDPPFVFDLSRRLVDRFDVHVIAPHARGTATYEVMSGVHVHRYRYAPERLERLAYDGGILPRLRRYPWLAALIPFFLLSQMITVIRLRRETDLIHAHWVLPQGLIALLVGQRPLLCTAHGGDLFALRGKVAAYLKRWVVRRLDRLAVVSRAMADEAEDLGIDPVKVLVAPMGVDLRETFTPVGRSGKSGKRLLFVGRLVAKKGVDVLIRSLPEVLRHHPDTTLTVIGDGPERMALESLAGSLDVLAAIQFKGAVPNHALPDMFRDADVVAFPSVIDADGDREGFGLVAVEALGCGCAVVASDLPAMRDFLIDGRTALIVPSADDQALGRSIVRLFDDPELSSQLGQSGRAHVLERYDWMAVADRYASQLQQLLITG